MKFRSPGEEPLHIALTSGHTLVITPEGVEVPETFRREAISRGAEPLGSDGANLAPVHQSNAGGDDDDDAKSTEEKRLELIKVALRTMLSGADEEDFTAAGLPNLKRLQFLAGFNVPRTEADAAWAQVQAEEAGK